MINKRWIAVTTLVALLGGGLGIYAGNIAAQAETPQATAVRQLLAKSLPDSEGKPHSLSQWNKHFLVVNFWATWCTPCVQEMPELSALQKELQGTNSQIIGLGIDSPSNIAEFTKKHPVSYPVYVAGIDGSELSRALGNQAGGLPFTVLINGTGKVVKTYLGRLKMAELRADITKFSAEKAK
ncbi:TlpA disulfide reductase family protein [Undibacterium sp. CCC2.1]|nr:MULTISPECIES: TlpA disulfide reductase family protein [unclassified Undibacterium]MEB0140450.1 TlpA disulfide reductase family protein [Undibacterium sp. CCC2.1]MEB0173541.1 TlpA disulfide reductase family protein [Undibacterium sp. CCC1.1]MEB0177467.1 TlpA disulfide reductase family protein [Undibacterium sp. CCC3.4]MEB0214343.1 TlpA disulfide reductase family protein [Undibacterium sp. 5I2]